MTLFQIDNINIYQDIINTDIKDLTEAQTNSTILSDYIKGDRRFDRNETTRIKYRITGQLKSQHLLNYFRSLSEKDNGEGDIKCFFIEEYSQGDPNFANEIRYQVFFSYCHIDIYAKNASRQNRELDYNIDFVLSLSDSHIYNITNSNTSFLYDRLKLQGSNNIFRYDNNQRYDQGNRYDGLIKNLTTDKLSLRDLKSSLGDYYKKITCCENKDENIRLYHIDNVVRPFIFENKNQYSGIINKNVAEQPFNLKQESNNFWQGYISNPFSNVLATKTTYIASQQFQRQGLIPTDPFASPFSSPYLIGNLNFSNNTASSNGIIQIFRNNFGLTNAINGYLAPLQSGINPSIFQEIRQRLSVKVYNNQQLQSHIDIICNSSFILNNLKMIVIHPHLQKVYGFFNEIDTIFSLDEFKFEVANYNLVDLENYMLSGQLKIENQIGRNWFLLSSQSLESIFDKKRLDSIEFSNTFSNQSTELTENTAIFCQIYSLEENKLI